MGYNIFLDIPPLLQFYVIFQRKIVTSTSITTYLLQNPHNT
nr:MAG TPA: hypothetical protein [Caudoviricetes sp.]